jgi:hypothetical protein
MESARGQSGADALIKKLHERPHIPLADSLRAPAHVHYKAFRMADPRGGPKGEQGGVSILPYGVRRPEG